MTTMKKKIYPCLWFNGDAREAAELYCSVFNDTRITSDNQMVVMVDSSRYKFMLLNGGPEFKFNPSVSFYTICETEEELNKTWKKLLEGGSVMMPLDKYPWSSYYGWLQDRFGISWQLTLGKVDEFGQKFTPALMFTGEQNGNAEKAIQLYSSLFKDSGIRLISRYGKNDNDTEGNINHAQFLLNDQVFIAMDSSFSHNFSFNEAISFVVECEDQEEIDHFWYSLTRDGGEESQCGWLKDKYGISWQIIPEILSKLMSDPQRSQKVIDAFMKMKKFEIDKLVTAAEG
jgi:predicted 3-demethylubiquinone-9 3-methyltransferase (glyoxalase superfamily)